MKFVKDDLEYLRVLVCPKASFLAKKYFNIKNLDQVKTRLLSEKPFFEKRAIIGKGEGRELEESHVLLMDSLENKFEKSNIATPKERVLSSPHNEFKNFVGSSLKTNNTDKLILEVGCGKNPIVMKDESSKLKVYYLDPNLANNDQDFSSTIEKSKIGMKFDIIIMKNVLYHLVDPYLALNNLRSYLKDGGFFFLQDFSCEKDWKVDELFSHLIEGNFNHFILDHAKLLKFLGTYFKVELVESGHLHNPSIRSYNIKMSKVGSE